jgi:hypothetical protein
MSVAVAGIQVTAPAAAVGASIAYTGIETTILMTLGFGMCASGFAFLFLAGRKQTPLPVRSITDPGSSFISQRNEQQPPQQRKEQP